MNGNRVVPRAAGLALVLIQVGTMLMAAASQSTENHSFSVQPGDTLVIQNDYGRVRVEGASVSDVQAKIRRIAGSDRELSNVLVRAEKRDSKIHIHSTFFSYRAESVYIDVKVPAFVNVVVWGAQPAVEIAGLSGYVRAYTQGGMVTATDLSSSVSLTTESGDVLFYSHIQPDRDIRLESVRGNIECRLIPELNVRGWVRAGDLLSWNREVEFSRGHLEKQVGVGGPLLFASSLEGKVSILLNLDPAAAASRADLESSLPPRRSRTTQSSDSGSTNRAEPPAPSRTNRRAPTPSETSPNPSDVSAEPRGSQSGSSSEEDVSGGYSLKVDVNWTNLNASVRDRRTNRNEPDLLKEDFLVYEEGQLQTVERFESTEAPFSLLLLLDVSGSTREAMSLIKDASVEFVHQINPNDRIAIATFNSRVRLVQRFTNDRSELSRTIRRIRSGGGTAFYDALSECIHDYMSGVEGRKAVVVFTDGVDNQLTGDYSNGSSTTFRDLFRSIQEVDSIIYSIFLNTDDNPIQNRGPSRRGGSVIDILEDVIRGGGLGQIKLGDSEAYRVAREQLQMIADQTGGRMYAPHDIYDLSPTYREIADDLRIQYTLAYNSTNPNDGGWREIKVQIRDRRELVVRTRKGYFAPKI